MDNSESPALLILEKKPFQDEEEEIKALPSNFKSFTQYFQVCLSNKFKLKKKNDVFSRHSIITEGNMSEVII